MKRDVLRRARGAAHSSGFPAFCQLEQRIGAVHKTLKHSGTLADLLNDVPEPELEPEAPIPETVWCETMRVQSAKQGGANDPGRTDVVVQDADGKALVLSSNKPDAFNFETFIIAKGPKDAYFRSNPPWIAQHVVAKFRTLLIKLRDEALCIDYSLLKKKRSTVNHVTPLTQAKDSHQEALLSRRALMTQEEQERNPLGDLRRSRRIGTTTAMTRGKVVRNKELSGPEYTRYVRKHVASLDYADRFQILNTLRAFPFEKIEAHGRGSMRFQEVLRYFQRELHCKVLRNWTEEDALGVKGVTFFAELTRPQREVDPLLEMLHHLNKAEQERRVREHLLTTTGASRTFDMWFGEGKAPIDPLRGNIWNGTVYGGRTRQSFGVVGSRWDDWLAPTMLPNRDPRRQEPKGFWSASDGDHLGPRFFDKEGEARSTAPKQERVTATSRRHKRNA